MPRNTIQDQTQERQAFLLALFREQPEISRQDASESYKEKFGSPLPPRLFNQMKEQVQEELASATEAEAEVEEVEEVDEESAPTSTEEAAQQLKAAAGADAANGAAQQPKAAKAKAGKGARHIFVDAAKENLVFLERIVSQLQEAGAANVRIDHSTDRWMVLVVDGK